MRILRTIGLVAFMFIAVIIGVVIGKINSLPQASAAKSSPNCAYYHQRAIEEAEAALMRGGWQEKQAYAQLSYAWSAIAANCAKL